MKPKKSRQEGRDGITEKYQRSRDAVMRREEVQTCAGLFQNAMKMLHGAEKLPEGSEQEAKVLRDVRDLWRQAGMHLFALYCGSGNLPETLRMVALASDGKLRGKNSKIDDAAIKSYKRVNHKIRKGQKGYDIGLAPTCPQWYPEFMKECERNGITPAPTAYAGKRRLKILGYYLQSEMTRRLRESE